MRRFPAPPIGGTSATPSTPRGGGGGVTTDRSIEAPMQYEWEKPRQFPSSLFSTPGGGDTDGERARKRTHYEAMDVDTPPQPLATTITHQETKLEPLSFDPKRDFHPQEAFGLNDREVREVVMADNAEELVDREEEKENLAVAAISGGGTRRRNNTTLKGGNRKVSSSNTPAAVTIETDDEDEVEHESGYENEGAGFLGTLQKRMGKRAGGGGEFNFQVHHHHAAPNSIDSITHSTPERWLQSNTPYVLLGYLQFGSLTLFALLVLSLLVLFLYTLFTDIQTRLSSLTLELRSEILSCAKAYVDNRCEPSSRIPAMERKCSEWEECMNREIIVVGKTRVVAETLAEIVNGFVDVISFKTMLFVLLTLGITIYGSSAALSLLSSRASTHNHSNNPIHQPPPHHYYPPPYGLPYNGGQTPWVIENGSGNGNGNGQGMMAMGNQLGLGAPPALGVRNRKNS